MNTPLLPSTPNPDSSDKLLAILCHLSIFMGVAFILPLVVYLLKKGESPYAVDHAREALNFHISVIIYTVISIILCFVFFIGVPLLFVIGIGSVILAILATIRASEGAHYRYPLTLRLIP